jgi:hypothetical protein
VSVFSQVQAQRAWWRCLAPSSLAVAASTGLIVWIAVADVLAQGRLHGVLSAGRAELAAPLLVALVVATGICERIWPAERRPVLARGHVQDACYHRLHHARDNQGVNLGVVLTIWDVVARRARFPGRHDSVGRTGLAGRPVPVEQGEQARSALALVAEQLLEPFQARGDAHPTATG